MGFTSVDSGPPALFRCWRTSALAACLGFFALGSSSEAQQPRITTRDSLVVISWHPEASDSVADVVLAPVVRRAIAIIVPGWRLRLASEIASAESPGYNGPGVLPRAIVADLDGDGEVEAVLWGVIPDSAQAGLPAGADYRRDWGVIVGVQPINGRLAIQVLHAGWEEAGGYGTNSPLSFALRLDHTRGRRAVTWLDGDCNVAEGYRFTLWRHRWRTARIKCGSGAD